jgi:hypothetical protein
MAFPLLETAGETIGVTEKQRGEGGRAPYPPANAMRFWQKESNSSNLMSRLPVRAAIAADFRLPLGSGA